MVTPTIPQLIPSFDVQVRLGSLDDLGETRAGHRRIIPIIGGRISGDIEADILPGGADWQRIRRDGGIEIDVRCSARTDRGELLFLQAVGVRTGSTAALAALSRGEQVPPEDYYFRTTVSIETSSPELSALQDRLYLASCIRDADGVRYTAYRVT